MKISYFNAKPYYDTDTVRETMLEALPAKNEEMLDKILQRYNDDEQMSLVGCVDEKENMLGLIGVKFDTPETATILHLMANNSHIQDAIKQGLINKIISMYKLKKIVGRASEPNLKLFLSIGFRQRLIGEKPLGTNWYAVEKEI